MTPPPERCFGHNSDVDIPAVYTWHAPNGNVIPLCVDCCAAWRLNAATLFADDPLMQPLQIHSRP